MSGHPNAPQPTYPVSSSHPTLVLDSHTRQFFDPDEWEGAVEAVFNLGASGLENSCFQGRLARLCNGHLYIVLQAVGGDGSVFLRRLPSHMARGACTPEDIGRYWTGLLSLQRVPGRRGALLPVLREVGGNCALARAHVDEKSGFGALVCSQGHAYLFDLRDVESAQKRHRPFVELGNALCPKGMAALVEMGNVEFHARMNALFRDESSGLFQTLRFYQMSDDGRSMEVFGCDYAALKRALQMLGLALDIALGPGGELEGFQQAGWYPWDMNPEEALSVHQSNGWWEDTAAPEKLSGLMGEICNATGCQLRLERHSDEATRGEREHIACARGIGLEWAGELRTRGKAGSAHETMDAAWELKKMMRAKGRVGP